MSNISFDFAGRTAVVTGAARGIGFEIASLLSRSGADVFLMDRDAEEVQQAATELGAAGRVVDVSSTAAVTDAVESVIAETGRLDILVNNAGIVRDAVLWKISDDDWEDVLAVHLGGTFG